VPVRQIIARVLHADVYRRGRSEAFNPEISPCAADTKALRSIAYLKGRADGDPVIWPEPPYRRGNIRAGNGCMPTLTGACVHCPSMSFARCPACLAPVCPQHAEFHTRVGEMVVGTANP
jgi:hypothetical protein